MMNITPPPALHGDEQAKLTQIYRYLFRLSESLNATAATIDSQATKASEAVAKAAGIDPATVSADVGEQYTSLVSLVVKTANIVQSQMDKVVTTLNSKYKASGEFGELTEEVRREIEETAKHTIENFQYGSEVLNIPEMAADFEAYKIETEGYIKRGIIDYDKDGFPVFGIAIGQELKSREVTIDGVVHTEFDTTKNMATYTADKLSFWIDGVEVAYLSQSELVVTRIIVSDSIRLGDWDIKVNAQDGLTIQQRIGNEIVTASQINMVADQIDLSGNKSIKLSAEQINAVANEIDLSGNKSIKLTAEQINAVAGQIDLTSNKSITMLAGEAEEANAKADNLDRLSNIEVIEGTFAQTERREGEGIRIYSEIGPKRDLSKGDPYPLGGGRNLCPFDEFMTNASGGNTTSDAKAPALTAGQSVMLYGETTDGIVLNGSNAQFIFKDDSGATVWAISPRAKGTAVTVPGNYGQATKMHFYTNSSLAGKTVRLMIEVGSATEWSPSYNTCPIEGWTGLDAFAGGKNLCDAVLVQGTRSTNGVLSTGTWAVCVTHAELVPVVPGIKVYISTSIGAFTSAYRYYLYDKDKQLISTVGGIAYNAGVDIPSNAAFFAFQYAGTDYERYIGAQIMVSTKWDDYAPYQGNTYFLDFGETVYGGKVDWHAGEMTVTREVLVLDGSENWSNGYIANGKDNRFELTLRDKKYGDPSIASGSLNVLCNAFACQKTLGLPGVGKFRISQDYSANNGLFILFNPPTSLVPLEDVSAWKTWLSQNPVQIELPLMEPYTIQLTSVQIETLQGINTVYTDADGGRVEFGHSPIEDIQNAVDALEEAQAESALYLKLDAENKVVRIGQTEVTSEFDIDAYGAGVVVGGKVFSRFEGERVLIGDMEMRKPANIGGLAFDSIMT